MTEDHRYYRLTLTLIEASQGTQTASYLTCIACRRSLSPGGGGATYICEDCYSALRSGKLSHHFRQETS